MATSFDFIHEQIQMGFRAMKLEPAYATRTVFVSFSLRVAPRAVIQNWGTVTFEAPVEYLSPSLALP
jgi:hypothetical protein